MLRSATASRCTPGMAHPARARRGDAATRVAHSARGYFGRRLRHGASFDEDGAGLGGVVGEVADEAGAEDGHRELAEGRDVDGALEEVVVEGGEAFAQGRSQTGDALGGFVRGGRGRAEHVVAELL